MISLTYKLIAGFLGYEIQMPKNFWYVQLALFPQKMKVALEIFGHVL